MLLRAVFGCILKAMAAVGCSVLPRARAAGVSGRATAEQKQRTWTG